MVSNDHWGGNQRPIPRKGYVDAIRRLRERLIAHGIEVGVAQSLSDAFADVFSDIADSERNNYDVIERNTAIIMPFSFNGAFTASTSPPWYPQHTALITKIHCALGTTGSSTTTVQLKVNGSVVASVNLGSGVPYNSATLSKKVFWYDSVTCTVSAAGTGAADLTIQVKTR